MKIYINHLNLDILPKIMKVLNEYLIKIKNYIQIYATEGTYQINELNSERLICVDNDIEILLKYYEDFELIVDKSYYIEEIVNRINCEHISIKMKKYIYEINKKSNIQLIIEEEEEVGTPSDIYIEIPNNIDINDALVKKEIIVFLSLLNNIVL